MELVEGITLKAYINKKGKLTVREATSIALQVARALRPPTITASFTGT